MRPAYQSCKSQQIKRRKAHRTSDAKIPCPALPRHSTRACNPRRHVGRHVCQQGRMEEGNLALRRQYKKTRIPNPGGQRSNGHTYGYRTGHRSARWKPRLQRPRRGRRVASTRSLARLHGPHETGKRHVSGLATMKQGNRETGKQRSWTSRPALPGRRPRMGFASQPRRLRCRAAACMSTRVTCPNSAAAADRRPNRGGR
jgi:hypothetical protein